MLEILAPAGSMDALRAAVQNGAHAVYLGCGKFNARQGAKNFTPETLQEAVKYCHIRGVAVHLTLNTLVSDKETGDIAALIHHAAKCGVDAFIVQDLGVISMCREIAPHIPLHGSTQMSIHSLAGVQLCSAWGLSRVVLSRELSRDEIRYICQNSPIEIEVFGHGALCMCYSGQCYLSAAIGGRSGNRGRCAQPCRQSYGYGRHQSDSYPLSLKDNCLVTYLQELERMGVRSVKLEGRMKRPEYVAAVTGVYRQAANGNPVTQDMMQRLHTAFNRQGFTDGYYTGKLGQGMFGTRDDKDENAQWLKQMRQTYEATEQSLVPIRFEVHVKEDGASLTVFDEQGRSCTVRGPMPEMARLKELTAEELANRLEKTGGTPYLCRQVKVNLTPGLTLSASSINAMRRDALNQLTALRGRQEDVKLGKHRKPVIYAGERSQPAYTVQVTSREQITKKLLKMKPAVLYVPLHVLAADLQFTQALCGQVRVCAVLPRIVHDGEVNSLQQSLRLVKASGVREALVGNLGHLLPVRECGMAIRGDFGLNLFNSTAVNMAKQMELRSACLSFEMTLPQMRDVSKAVPCEIFAYGRLPLMVTENCLIRSRTGSCTCHLSGTKLTDKTGADFPVIKDGSSCRSVLLNGKKLNWLDRAYDLYRLGLWAVRLYFTTENPNEVDQVLAACDNPQPFDPGTSTRGLYLRGLD